MSYSIDLRERVVKYRRAGHTIKETCEVFRVGNYAVSKWVKQYKETGDLSNKPLNRGFKKIDPEKLKAYISEHPDWTIVNKVDRKIKKAIQIGQEPKGY